MGLFKSLEKAIIRPIGGAIKGAFKWLLGIPDFEDPRGMEVSREGSNVALPVVYGERLVGGVKVHKWVTDSITGLTGIKNENRKNAYLHMIVAFCHGEIESFEKFYVNDDHLSAGRYMNNYFVATRTGAEGQSVITQAVDNISNWDDTMIGNRVAYAYFVFYQDKDQKIWRGEPNIQAVVRGRKIYDPRTGTTEYSKNNALASLDWLTDDLYGRGLSLADCDVNAFIEKANFCDESTQSTITKTKYVIDPILERPVPSTTIEVVDIGRYEIAAVLDTSDTLLANYRRLLQSFRAFPRRSDGKVSLEVETSGLPVMTFDSALDQINGAINWQVSGQKERYNSFTVVFPSKDNRYERDEATYPDPDSQLYTDWLAEDNGKELVGRLEVNTLASKSAALQTAEIAAKRSRFGGSLNINVDSRARLLEGGDIIGVSDVSFGWTNKPFRVDKVSERENGTFDLKLVEHENSVYPWSGSSWDEIEGGTWLGDPYSPDAPTNLSLAPDPTLSTTGTLTWDSVDDSFVRHYDVVIVRVSDSAVIKEDTTRGTRYTVPLLDVGQYNINVYSVTTLGYRSVASVINFTLTVPSAPSSIVLTPSDWEIYIAPQLTGIGLGTQFEFDYIAGNGSGHTPTPQAKGSTYTVTGLLPDTLYTVFARTVNAYGVSAWVSNSATTTNVGAQVEPFIDGLQEEIDNAQSQIDNLNTEVSKSSVSGLLARQVAEDFTEVFNDYKRIEDIDTEERQRKTEVFDLSASLDTVNGSLTSTILRVDQVEVDIDGNASAISAVQLEVNSIDSSLTSTISRVDQVEIDSDNNASAISGLQLSVSDIDSSLTSTISRVDQVEIDSSNNASAISGLDARVENNEDFASAQLVLNSAYESELGDLSARAFLGVDVNDRVTGINIEGSTTNGVISLIADKVEFLRPTDFSVGFQWDAVNDTLVFDGKVIATDSTFTGTVTGSTFNGGTITGAILQTSTSGQRVIISGTEQRFYPATGTDYVSLDGDSINVQDGVFDFITITPSQGSGGVAFDGGGGQTQFYRSASGFSVRNDNTTYNGLSFFDDGEWAIGSSNSFVEETDTELLVRGQDGLRVLSPNFVTLQSSTDVRIKMRGEVPSGKDSAITTSLGFKLLYNGLDRLATTNTGVTVAGTVSEVSDPSLKDFNHQLDGAESLDKIEKLELWNYAIKETKQIDDGVNARQAMELFPNAVEEDENGLLSFNYRTAFIHGLSAIKELSKRLKEIEDKQ